MFSKRLKELRIQKKLSVKEITEKTNIPMSTYRSWEEGVGIVGEAPYFSLSRVFGVSISFLLTGEQEQVSLTMESSRRLVNKINTVKNTICEIEKIITLNN